MRSPHLGDIPHLAEEFGKEFAVELFRRANFCRHFELKVKEAADLKLLSLPIYLSLGTEYVSAALSMVLPQFKIFGQHRAHSLYLNFGGKPEALRDELLGLPTGCSGGMSGSNAIQCREIQMFGHSGLMGEQVPIAVGAAFASREPCLVISGDASIEEDYIYPSLGWASTHQLPCLFVCEDNDLSILTPVSVRRSWSAVGMAQGLGIHAIDIGDNPWLIAHHALRLKSALPGFMNIRVVRELWHAGTGTDGELEWDRSAMAIAELNRLGLASDILEIDEMNSQRAQKLWEEPLQRLSNT